MYSPSRGGGGVTTVCLFAKPEHAHHGRACSLQTSLIKLHALSLFAQVWYGKAWAVFGLFMAAPIYYHYNYVDEFRQPFVSAALGSNLTGQF